MMPDRFEYHKVPWYQHHFKWWLSIDLKSFYKSIWLGPFLLVWSTWQTGSLIGDIREGLRYLNIGYYPDYESCEWSKTFIDD